MIVFLDIDGVLKPFGYEKYSTKFDPFCVKTFNEHFAEKDVVIASAWSRYLGDREADFARLKRIFFENGVECNIIDIFSDYTLHTHINRFEKIKEYVKDNNISEYIILDDDLSIPNAIDSYTGLTKEWLNTNNIH